MTHRILGFLSVGLLTVGLTFSTAQAQSLMSDPVPPDGPGDTPATSRLAVVLYSQIDTPNQGGISSEDRTDDDSFDDQMADDFVVPGGPGWAVEQVEVIAGRFSPGTFDVGPFNVFFYNDAAGSPGTLHTSFASVAPTSTPPQNGGYGSFVIDLPANVILAAGTYWLSVQAASVDGTAERWFWDSTLGGVIGTESHWQNPPDGYGSGCTTWMTSTICFGGPLDIQFAIGGTVVPVELISFDAVVSGTDVSLNWETASETNNAGFEVQMQNGEGWDVLSFVEGHGTTTEAQTYSYTAEDLGVGTHTFRLKQIDFDGRFEYHGNLEVAVETPGTHLISSAYPNPFNPQSQFTLAVAQEQHVTAELFNTLGQRVAVLFDGTVEANQAQLVTIEGAGLASGMYVVRVTGERFSEALSVTLLK